jgi:hypothetical protein
VQAVESPNTVFPQPFGPTTIDQSSGEGKTPQTRFVGVRAPRETAPALTRAGKLVPPTLSGSRPTPSILDAVIASVASSPPSLPG